MKSTLVRYAEAKTTLYRPAWLDRTGAAVATRADIGGWNLQEAKTECDGQPNLLGFPKAKLPNLVYGKTQDDEVGENGRCRVGNPCADLVDATARNVGVPELLYWNAYEYEEECDADDPRHHEGPNDPC